MEGNENFGKKIIEKFLKEQNIETETSKEEIYENIGNMILKGGWAAYNSNNINDAIFLSTKLQKFIKNKKGAATEEEQKFIDTIREAIKIRDTS